MDFNYYYKLLVAKLEHWLAAIVKLLPNIILAAVILVAGIFIASFLRKIVAKLFRKVSNNDTLNNLFVSFVNIAFIGVVVFTALTVIGLDKAVTTVLAGAGIIGLALAFAFQDIAANFIAGIFLSFRRPLHVHDIVKVKDYMGKVEEINLRDTIIRTFQGQMVIIPNKEIFQNPIENYTILGKRRFDLEVGVSYGDDLEKVKRIALEAVKDLPNLSSEDKTSFFYRSFGDSSINFILRLWVNCPDQPVWLEVGSEAIMRIKKAFDSNDIMIPYPIRTLDFGIKGGEKLSEMVFNKQAEHNL